MEKVLANELIKYIIILSAAAVGVTGIMLKIVSKLKSRFKPLSKASLLHLLIFVLLISISALVVALSIFFQKTITSHIFLQAYFLVLGSVHVFYFYRTPELGKGETAFFPQMLFTVLLALLGSLAFILIYHWLNKNDMGTIMVSSLVFFIIPFFFYHSFEAAISIPPKVVKQWFYPLGEEIEEPEDNKMKNLVLISFEFAKRSKDDHLTNFRAKAPRDMEFGQLFYYFINDYNEMHSNSKIQYLNGTGEPHGWIFYKKPRWYSIVTKYIDGEKTIFSNNIRENDVIVCTRS